MPLVRVVRNYDYPPLFRQSPGNTGEWGSYSFTEEPVEEADFLVVLNHPTNDVSCKIRNGGCLMLMQEPPFERNDYFKAYFNFFDRIVSHSSGYSNLNVLKDQAALPWHLDLDYDVLKANDSPDYSSKKDEVSWITSNINLFPTHQLRLNFIEVLKGSSLDFRLFGRGFQPIENKFDVLRSSKYTIAAENFVAENYWTEKLQDALLSWNIPFYYGCPNINNYLPINSIVHIDLERPEFSLDLILERVNSKYWDHNISSIAEARSLILDKLQFYPKIVSLLESMGSSEKKKVYFIPSDPFKKSIFQKLISKLKP
jgi:hypothetical protein